MRRRPGAASGRGSGEPGLSVFGAAGEPAGVEEAVEDGVDDPFGDVGAVEDVEAVELAGVVEEVLENRFEGRGHAQAFDVDVVEWFEWRGFAWWCGGLTLRVDEDLAVGLGVDLVVTQAFGHQLLNVIL